MAFSLFGWCWSLPWTAVGLGIGILALVRGGRLEWYRGTIGCYGDALSVWLSRIPIAGGASAMTIGHVILARSRDDLVRTHAHEWIHVLQYRRWGLFFVPAYLTASVWLWCRQRDAYLDNPFEREAYEKSIE
jgi:hypothetical protein